MRAIGCILFLISCVSTQAQKTLREEYSQAIEEKQVAIAFLKTLQQMEQTPRIEGYQGAVKMISAKHWINPFKKLSYFKEGKQQLDNAIKKVPKDIELRYLRYGIQKNAPRFLNYSSNLEADKKMLTDKEYLKNTDEDLRERIEDIIDNF